MRYINLEYKEKTGNFHFNNVNSTNLFGWESVCNNISYENALEFTEDLNIDYDNPLKYNEVKDKFIDFIRN